MSRVRLATEIDAPQTAVWRVLSDPKAWEAFATYMKSLRPLDQGPLRLGSRVKVTPKGMPGSVWQVTEISEPRSFTWEASVLPGLKLIAGHEANARYAGTEAVLWLQSKGLLAGLFSPFLSIVFRRNIHLASRGLKRYCEGRAAGTWQPSAP
jgi:Polyketide cyclase / dehydrase and lipid transport